MRRFWLPDFEKKLIGELQRQQNSAQFCDTLLQTEGISIPIHSSVLSALSPPLSQRLLASPAPPAGQKRKLQLHTVKPQTLIKLVALLYSGELEVNGALEQRDFLAAVHSFGLPDLVDGEKFEVKSSQEGEEKGSRKIVLEKRDMQIQVTPRSFYVSTGTQTVSDDTNQTIESSQSLKMAITSSRLTNGGISRTITSETLSSTTFPVNSSECSDGGSIHELSSDCMTSATSTLPCPSDKMMLLISPSETSNCSRLQEEEEKTNLAGTSLSLANSNLMGEQDGQKKMSKYRERTNQENMEIGSVIEGRQAGKSVASKNLEKMQEMMETTQISIKVKLRRRRTKEEMWEVVNNLQDTDALSGVTTLRPDNNKRPQGDLAAVQPSPSTALACQTSVPQSITSSPKPGPHTSDDTSETISFPDGDPAPLPLQAPRPIEETDEQIEKFLEDIMIGLNILPNVEKGNSKSQDKDLCQDGELYQVQQDKVLYCACYEHYGNQSGNNSTDKAVHAPGCTVHSSVRPCGTNSSLVTTQENSSASSERADGPQISSQSPHTSPCLSESHDSNPEDNPSVLKLLPLTTENEVNLFSMADLQFLPCLSPLDSNNNSKGGHETPAQPPLPGIPWLMDNPRSLEFPLNTIAQDQNHSPSEQCTTDGLTKQTSTTKSDALPANSRLELKTERNLANGVAPQNVKRKCPNLRLNKTCRDLSTDGTINFSHCLVSLSSNNVLANETAPSNESETDKQTTTIRRLRSKTKFRSEAVAGTPIRTRRKSPSPSTLETSTPDPATCKNDRKRGRPRKRVVKVEESKQQIENPSLEKMEEAKHKARRRPREKDLKESQPKQAIPMENSAKPDDKDHTPPAEKRPRMVSLKEFQELIKRQHSKTRHLQDKCQKEQRENNENCKREDAHRDDPIQEAAQSQQNEADVTQDGEEQNSSVQLVNQSTNSQKKPQSLLRVEHNAAKSNFENSNLSKDSDQSVFCVGVIATDVTKLSEEIEQSQKASPKLDDGGVRDITNNLSENEVTIDDEESFPLAANVQRENSSAEHRPNLANSKNREGDTGEPKPMENSAGHPQDDEEEVDVLLHSSPDRASVTVEGQKLVEVSPDEEEGEDSNEVDVTGSETEV